MDGEGEMSDDFTKLVNLKGAEQMKEPMGPKPPSNTQPTILEELKHIGNQMATRQNFKERIAGHTFHAENEAHRVIRLHRLIELLDKHPDVCEILDLMDGLNLR